MLSTIPVKGHNFIKSVGHQSRNILNNPHSRYMLNNSLAVDLLSVIFTTTIFLPSRESEHNGYSTMYSASEKDSDRARRRSLAACLERETLNLQEKHGTT
jgi:hypothetical protein